MSDKELLELAAKAAGYAFAWVNDQHLLLNSGEYWNPLADDGDALRLAVKLKFDIMQTNNLIQVYPRLPKCIVINQEAGDDPLAATRRAIVRAAAEIGKEMK